MHSVAPEVQGWTLERAMKAGTGSWGWGRDKTLSLLDSLPSRKQHWSMVDEPRGPSGVCGGARAAPGGRASWGQV